MQTIITILLVLLAIAYVLLRWLPKRWWYTVAGKNNWLTTLVTMSARSCGDQCKDCSSDSHCATSKSSQEQVIHIHRKSKSSI